MNWLLFAVLIFLILAGVPIFFCMETTSVVFLSVTKLKPLILVAQRMVTGLDSFTLVAVPLFVCAGYLMESTSISRRIVDFVESLVGNVRGSMGAISLICCAIFAALTGSGPATVAAIGGIMMPALLSQGYSRRASAGLLAAGGALGPIIPPSGIMIVYGATMGISITRMFMGGMIPGILFCALLCLTNSLLVRKWNLPLPNSRFSAQEKWRRAKRAVGPLMLPIIVLGTIYGGICTPTEAAAISMAYAIILSIIYKEFNLKLVVDVFKRSVVTSAATCSLLAVGNLFGWLLSATKIPATITMAVMSVVTSKTHFLLLFSLILFIVGALMDGITSTVILAPILVPIGLEYGIDPLHIGCVFCINLVVGFITPPFGINLFTSVSLTGESFNSVVKGVFPYMITLIAGVLLITFVPAIVTWFPNLLYG